MNMLPRLKPRCFYDLVIEVAIVRPGPIQGDMVHPYLRRRSGREPVVYPAPDARHGEADELKRILGKTQGVPLFQEQAMRIAMEAARFSDAEVNELRKAMATFRRRGTIGRLEDKMVSAMVAAVTTASLRNAASIRSRALANTVFPRAMRRASRTSSTFRPGSSAIIRRPSAAALLNSQPMGFYAPAQIVRDARAHGVEVREVDVCYSEWDATLEAGESGQGPALRLGFRQIDGFSEAAAAAIVAARGPAPPASGAWRAFEDVRGLQRRSGLSLANLERLASGDAMRSLGLDRRQALWAVKGLQDDKPLPLFAWSATAETGEEPVVDLPVMPLAEHVVNDYQTLRLSLKAHPMSFLRSGLSQQRVIACADLRSARNGAWVGVAGVVLVRQRPGSAKGVVFMTLEDETGIANVVVWPKTLERFRVEIMTSRVMLVRGRVQRHEDIIHVVSSRIEDRSDLLATLMEDRDVDVAMPIPIANADEVVNPDPGSARSASHPRWQPNRQAGHPRDARVIPPSRDFH